MGARRDNLDNTVSIHFKSLFQAPHFHSSAYPFSLLFCKHDYRQHSIEQSKHIGELIL